MMSGYDFDAYVHSIARRQPRRLPACLSVSLSVYACVCGCVCPGHCYDSLTGNPPRGLQFVLGTNSTPSIVDTIVMANLVLLLLLS